MDAFLTPTLLVSAAAFLTLLFGKIIADERAFADDRGWHIQLSGFLFVLMFIPIQSLIGYGIAYGLNKWTGFPLWLQIVNGVVIFAELLILTVIADWLMKRRYPFMGRSHASKLAEKFETEMTKDLDWGVEQKIFSLYVKTKENFLKREPRRINFVSSSTVYFSYAISYAWITQSYPNLVVTSVVGLGGLLLAAYIRSMQMAQSIQVNIHFTDDRDPLTDVTLLRVNDDNLRIRHNNHSVLLNKSLVFRIEEITQTSEQKS